MNLSSSFRRLPSAAALTYLAAITTSACGSPADPQGVLLVDVTVMPSAVQPGDSLLVTLTIANPTRRSVQLSSGDSCVGLPLVYHASERLAWDGTALGCLTVVSTFTVPAFGGLTREFPLVAFLQQTTAPWDYTVPPPPSLYTLVMQMHVDLPDAEAEFLVTN